MIDLCKLLIEDEKSFWQIISHHFGMGVNLIWCAPHEKDRPIIIDVDPIDFPMIDGEKYLYIFGFKDYLAGTLHPDDYVLFKQNKISGDTNIKYKNGIKISIDDVPIVYKLLQG